MSEPNYHIVVTQESDALIPVEIDVLAIGKSGAIAALTSLASAMCGKHSFQEIVEALRNAAESNPDFERVETWP